MNSIRFSTVLAAGVLAAVAGTAAGQSKPEKALTGDFSRPLDSAYAAPQSATQSVMVMSSSDGDETCEIRIVNGKVTCKINGKEVPADRVKNEGGQVTILDDSGRTIKAFQVWDGSAPAVALWTDANPGAASAQGQRLRLYSPQAGGGQAGAITLAQPQGEPKVMLGITMSAPPQAMLEHYKIQPGNVFMIERIIEGLPAAKAGIRKSDVVIEIDGQRPASTERLREVMKAKEPGDYLRLKVLREGEDKEIKVLLEGYDADKLGLAQTAPEAPQDDDAAGQRQQWQRSFPGGSAYALGWEQHGREIERTVRQAIEEALSALREDDDVRRSVGEAKLALERALKEFEKEGGQALRQFQRQFGDGSGRFFFGDRPGMVFQVPEPPAPPQPRAGGGGGGQAGGDERLRALREENARLREELDSMRGDLADIKAMLKAMQKNSGR